MPSDPFAAEPVADFAYGAYGAPGACGVPLAVSVYADRAHLRAQIVEDAQAAGLRIAASTGLTDGAGGVGDVLLGDVVLVDCPSADAVALASLARLDMRVAETGARLVVSTTIEALDAVFGCLDQSAPQLLVDPSRAERVIALGQVLARFPATRLRELSDEDRLMLLRLTEQVGQIAQRLDGLNARAGMAGDIGESDFPSSLEDRKRAFRFSDGGGAAAGESNGTERLIRAVRPPLPDPRLVRRIIRQRGLRARFFDGDLFADPAWDMLLDLTAARAEHARVSVTSLCIASGVPPTTALRWIGQLTDAGLFERLQDDTDRRRAFIALTDNAADAMARYFADLGSTTRDKMLV